MDSGFHTAVVNLDHLWMVTQREPERYRAKDVGHFLNPVTALLNTSRKALAGLGGLQIRPSAIHVKLLQELSVLN